MRWLDELITWEREENLIIMDDGEIEESLDSSPKIEPKKRVIYIMVFSYHSKLAAGGTNMGGGGGVGR